MITTVPSDPLIPKWNVLFVNTCKGKTDISIEGSNMISYALTSARSRWMCWTLSLKGEGFSTSSGGPADVDVSEKLVWSLLLHKNIFSLENFGENASKTFCFPVPVMARNGMLPANVFKPPLPGQRLTSCWRHEITFATMHVTCTDDDVSFCNGPGMLTRKIRKHVNCLVNTSICGNNNGNNCIKALLFTFMF